MESLFRCGTVWRYHRKISRSACLQLCLYNYHVPAHSNYAVVRSSTLRSPCTLGWKKGKLYVNRRVSPMTMIRWKRGFILLFLFDLILSWIHNSQLKAILRNLLRKSKITSLFYRDATLKYIIINPSAGNSTIFINIEKLYVQTLGYLV